MKHAVSTSAEHGHNFMKDPRTVGFSSEMMITRGTSSPASSVQECQDSVNQVEKRTLEFWLCKIKLDRVSFDRHFSPLAIEIHEISTCETRLAVTSFFTGYLGLRNIKHSVRILEKDPTGKRPDNM